MSGKAKQWVEQHFPTARGSEKAMLILVYGAGLDDGLAEAQQIIDRGRDDYACYPDDA